MSVTQTLPQRPNCCLADHDRNIAKNALQTQWTLCTLPKLPQEFLIPPFNRKGQTYLRRLVRLNENSTPVNFCHTSVKIYSKVIIIVTTSFGRDVKPSVQRGPSLISLQLFQALVSHYYYIVVKLKGWLNEKKLPIISKSI